MAQNSVNTKLEKKPSAGKKPLVEKKPRTTIAGFLNRTFSTLDRAMSTVQDINKPKKKKKP
jgi:hypothetical protein